MWYQNNPLVDMSRFTLQEFKGVDAGISRSKINSQLLYWQFKVKMCVWIVRRKDAAVRWVSVLVLQVSDTTFILLIKNFKIVRLYVWNFCLNRLIVLFEHYDYPDIVLVSLGALVSISTFLF